MQDEDDNITHSNSEQDPEPEQDRFPLLVQFNRSLYRIDNPEPEWFQSSARALPECSKCGDTLTFCFAPRIDPQIAVFAESYRTPGCYSLRLFPRRTRPTAHPHRGSQINQEARNRFREAGIMCVSLRNVPASSRVYLRICRIS
jgi:hypothetical protein